MEFLNGIFSRGFSLYKMLFMNKLRLFVNLLSMVFCKNLPVEGTVNSMEQKTRVFPQSDVHEFHLFKVIEVR
jgi:hypothetical protein